MSPTRRLPNSSTDKEIDPAGWFPKRYVMYLVVVVVVFVDDVVGVGLVVLVDVLVVLELDVLVVEEVVVVSVVDSVASDSIVAVAASPSIWNVRSVDWTAVWIRKPEILFFATIFISIGLEPSQSRRDRRVPMQDASTERISVLSMPVACMIVAVAFVSSSSRSVDSQLA